MFFNERAKKAKARGVVTAEMLVQLPLECYYCNALLTHERSEVDHKVPHSKGGTNEIDNLVRVCRNCNRQKYTKTDEEFDDWQLVEASCVVCGKTFKPRYSDYLNGNGTTCSRKCSGKRRWMDVDADSDRRRRRSDRVRGGSHTGRPVRADRG